jgi:hypothetical protein
MEEDVALRVGHREGGDGQAVPLDVGDREGMSAGDAHGSGLGIETDTERFAQRLDPSPNPWPGFEQLRVVPGTQQLGGCYQPRHPGADDDHPRRGGRGR